MRIRFRISDSVWYVANKTLIVNAEIDFVAIEPESGDVYCTILSTHYVDGIPKPVVVNQWDLHRTYRLALRSIKGEEDE